MEFANIKLIPEPETKLKESIQSQDAHPGHKLLKSVATFVEKKIDSRNNFFGSKGKSDEKQIDNETIEKSLLNELRGSAEVEISSSDSHSDLDSDEEGCHLVNLECARD